METPKCVPVRTCALTPCTGSPGYVKGWKWLSVGGGYFMMTYLGTLGLTLWQLLEADWGGGTWRLPPLFNIYLKYNVFVIKHSFPANYKTLDFCPRCQENIFLACWFSFFSEGRAPLQNFRPLPFSSRLRAIAWEAMPPFPKFPDSTPGSWICCRINKTGIFAQKTEIFNRPLGRSVYIGSLLHTSAQMIVSVISFQF